jgi:hypothetical protein
MSKIASRLELYAFAYLALWRLAMGGDPFGRTRVLWQARFKLLGIHAAICSTIACVIVLLDWSLPR